MNKIEIIKKKKEKYVHIRLQGNQLLNNRELEVIRSGKLTQVINPDVVIKNKQELYYNITNYVSLKEYMCAVTTKKRFLGIVLAILNNLKIAREAMLYNRNFVIDSDYIFVDPRTGFIKYIYIPVVNFDGSQDIGEFFNKLAFDTVFFRDEDNTYVRKYINYFLMHQNFSIFDFELFIRGLDGEDISNQSTTVFPNLNPSKVLVADANKELLKPVRYEGQNIKICPRCGKNMENIYSFCDTCGVKLVYKGIESDNGNTERTDEAQRFDVSKQAENIESEVNGIDEVQQVDEMLQGMKQNTSSDSGMPQLFQYTGQTENLAETIVAQSGKLTTSSRGETAFKSTIYPRMVRRRDSSIINVNKTKFYIGKSVNGNDYFISDNSAISRKHMYIEIIEDKYFVVDIGSTNGTYIDDRRIGSNIPTELKVGQRLRLADDEFLFEV